MNKIKLDHTKLDDAGLIPRLRQISAATATAPALAGLAAKLAPFETAIDDFETKFNAAKTADQAATTAHTSSDTARDFVLGLASQLANSAEGETQDDAELQAGGWHLRGARSTAAAMTAPQNVSSTAGDQEGTVDSAWDSIDGAKSYVGEHAAAPTGPWTQFYIGPQSSCTATGLTSGTLYYFRFRAVNSVGPGPWSDPSSKRAT